jgi:hypothetical protein
MQSSGNQSQLRGNTKPPYLLLVSTRDLFAVCFILVSCLDYSSVMTIEEVCSTEMSLDFEQNTLCYMPEFNTFHNWRRFKKNFPSSASRHSIHIHVKIQEVATKAPRRSGWCSGRYPNWVPLGYSHGAEATYPAGHMVRMLPDEKPSRCTRAALNKSYSVH